RGGDHAAPPGAHAEHGQQGHPGDEGGHGELSVGEPACVHSCGAGGLDPGGARSPSTGETM
ncbi:hypothetical protein LTR53_020142, partial [Teratosphaeriaceae sp. CCFEE 6253]